MLFQQKYYPCLPDKCAPNEIEIYPTESKKTEVFEKEDPFAKAITEQQPFYHLYHRSA